MTNNCICPAETPPMDIQPFFQYAIAYFMNSIFRTGEVVVHKGYSTIAQIVGKMVKFRQNILSAPGAPFGAVKSR